jgi:tetratricopeptide (TPR) repeat protein
VALITVIAGPSLRLIDQLHTSLIVPNSWFVGLVAVATIIAPLFAIAMARRAEMSRPVIVLMAVGAGGLAAAVLAPGTGAAIGLFFGITICFLRPCAARIVRFSPRLLVAGAVGYVAAGIAVRVMIDGGGGWWTGLVLFGVTATFQLALVAAPIPRRWRVAWSAAAWQRILVAMVIVSIALVSIPLSWIGGWRHEITRRIDAIKRRGGSITFEPSIWWAAIGESIQKRDWKMQAVQDIPFNQPLLATDLCLGVTATSVALNNPTAQDIRTLGTISLTGSLTLSGKEVDDRLLSRLPDLPMLQQLSLVETNVTGEFLADPRLLPGVTSVQVQASPFSNRGVEYLSKRSLLCLTLMEVAASRESLLHVTHMLPSMPTDIPRDYDHATLLRLTEDPGWHVRLWALQRLAELDPLTVSTPALRTALSDADERVRSFGVYALGQPRHLPTATTVVPSLIELAEKEGSCFAEVIELLGTIGTEQAYDGAEKILTTILGRVPRPPSIRPGHFGVSAEQVRELLASLRIRREVGEGYGTQYQLRNEGQLEEALPVFEKLLQAQRRHLGPDDERIQQTSFYVGELNNLLGNHDVAEPYLEEFISYARQAPGGVGQYGSALSHLAGIRRRQGSFIEAEELLRECLAIGSPEDWTSPNSKSLLGECLVNQGKFVEAEPILIAGFEGLLAREETIWDVLRPIRMTNSAQRLVTLYEKWDKPKEAAKWRKELKRIVAKYESEPK